MRKKQFENFDKEYIYCEQCNRLLPTKYFNYSYIRSNGTASRCKFCDWFIRHDEIPKIDDINEKQLKEIVEFIIFEKSDCINGLAEILDISIDKLVDILQQLKINGKKMYVKVNCKNCGTEIHRRLSEYKASENQYCCIECYWEDKSNYTGKLNKDYKRIHTYCTNCGKPLDVIPYDYNTKNSYGDNHNFCSQKCYWEFRSKYYIGDKSNNKNKIYTEEEINKMRILVAKRCKNQNRFNSKIQLKINTILDKNNIKYEREHNIKYYSVDNYLTDYNLIIEVMGDYWHSSPLKYNKEKYKINEMQKKGIVKDKQKHTYIKNHLNIEILYIWENDINNNPDLCEQLIKKYIECNGILENYHSFNWNLNVNGLCLNNNIIIPYQEMTFNKYKHLLKVS